MAHQPNNIKIVFKHERTEGISERYPVRHQTYYITAEQAEIMVKRDYQQRRDEAEKPSEVKRRSVQDIFKELGNLDYNNAKQQLRNTTYRSVSARDNEEDLSVIDVLPANIDDPETALLKREQLQALLAGLDQVDRAIVIGRLKGYGQSEIARQVGISQPAVNKRLKKLEKDFREKLA